VREVAGRVDRVALAIASLCALIRMARLPCGPRASALRSSGWSHSHCLVGRIFAACDERLLRVGRGCHRLPHAPLGPQLSASSALLFAATASTIFCNGLS
jgi:hypothetical protein